MVMLNDGDDRHAEFQDPHGVTAGRASSLEKAIGREVRRLRKQLDMTVTELASLAGLSSGMLSKIENGLTSPSLGTLQALSGALNVSVTAFFRKFDEQRDATFVKTGEGLKIERRGSRNGHHYHLLGHSVGKSLAVEPYLITIAEPSTVLPSFQHSGTEFLHMLEGCMDYQHNGASYRMNPGDSLFFDGEAPHGPEQLLRLPIKFIAVISYLRDGSE
jgi:transcriptional regulator with XRE-family HTH domain